MLLKKRYIHWITILLIFIFGCSKNKDVVDQKYNVPAQTKPAQIYSKYNKVDYIVQSGLVLDFEDIRPLIEKCVDIDELESIRLQLEKATDLEDFRQVLEQVGLIEFRDCPKGIEGYGIKQNP